MKKEWLVKALALGVVVLFVSVSCSSAISVDNKTSIKMILCSNVFSQISGYTLKLSNQQLKELDKIFDKLKIDLCKCKSEIEVIRIYKDTIVSLGDKNLLPNGLSVKQAQDLVIKKNFQPDINNFFNYSFYQNNRDDLINIICLISGKTSQTRSSPHWFGDRKWPFFINFFLMIFLGIPKIDATLTFGTEYDFNPYDGPAVGWIYIMGLRGIKMRDTPFYGRFDTIGSGHFGEWYFVGAYGFTGLFFEYSTESFYIGYAREVHIG